MRLLESGTNARRFGCLTGFQTHQMTHQLIHIKIRARKRKEKKKKLPKIARIDPSTTKSRNQHEGKKSAITLKAS